MRLLRLLVILCVALALSACARSLPRSFSEPPVTAEPASDLDAMMYGAPQSSFQSSTYTVRRARQVVPVRGAETFEDGPYTLDSGDKLRVVVFGQEGISGSYLVDAGGNVSLPLVGTVPISGSATWPWASTM